MAIEGKVDGRAAAHDALMRVLVDQQSLPIALDLALTRVNDPRERRLAKELAFGVMRWLPRLMAILEKLLDRPLKKKDKNIEAILLLGLHQLLFTRIPPHAAVAESVSVARALGKSWASGLVNAVLRRFQRERESLLAQIRQQESAEYSHPAWLIDEIRNAWPAHWRQVLEAGNQHPPMTLRVNQRRTSREKYLESLEANGLSAAPLPFTECGVMLDTPIDVASLPDFSGGAVSVQDAAAQLAAPLMALAPGLRILDACAAPGGKTGHILEMEPHLSEVVALDISADRVARLRQTLERLNLSCVVLHANASEPGDWWDGKPFDRILLDAPCSATGIIRRHPDIKFHRRIEDIGRLEENQFELLNALWPLLARDGLLLYATCSILPRENRDQISNFVDAHKDADVVCIDAAWGRADQVGRQILTGEHDMDGFYYASLAKR